MALTDTQMSEADAMAAALGYRNLAHFADERTVHGSHALHYGKPGRPSNRQLSILATLERALDDRMTGGATLATDRQVDFILSLENRRGDPPSARADVARLTREQASARIDELKGA